jgi:HSP20 family molecular chaperone IbpA
MKNNKPYLDLGTIFDEIFDAAEDLTNQFQRNFSPFGGYTAGGTFHGLDENVDYYPNYSYPPMNVYMTGDRSLVFEFALAGFDEKNLHLSFQGDYMVFSAKLDKELVEPDLRDVTPNVRPSDDSDEHDDNFRYFKRRLKLKDIEKQKYYVPLDKYAQDEVKAVYKNGILKVTVPPKAELDQSEGVKIEIIKEGA